jgi:parvulin-like peptidyl-prolyl isomerase
MPVSKLSLLLAFSVVAALPWTTTSAAARAGESSLPEGVYAVIDGETISDRDFDLYFSQYVREKLYHMPAQERLAGFRDQALDHLIEQRLTLHEAVRRGIEADSAAIEKNVKAIEARYSGTSDWPDIQAQIPDIRIRLAEQDIVRNLRKQVREVAEPSAAVLRTYYEGNQAMFTEPAAVGLSVILVSVDPASPVSAWREARDTAKRYHTELTEGVSFETIARTWSNHESAAAGGDLGFVHKGQVPKHAQDLIDRTDVGDITPPIKVLEGYTIFKVNARRAAHVMDFETIHERARGLYVREKSERQWERFIDGLKAASEVVSR